MIRPVISEYNEPAEFIQDMLKFRKKNEPAFSVLKFTKRLRKISPTLISLIIQKKRNISLDRVDELSKLLALSQRERAYFVDWIRNSTYPELIDKPILTSSSGAKRKEVSSHLLKDWINPYVKDCFQISAVQKNPELIYKYLSNIASTNRINKSIDFLYKEGHLRKTLSGETVIDAQLAVTDDGITDHNIRQFHKGALKVARDAIDDFPTQQRIANALIIPLDEKGYSELTEIINEFALKLQKFSEENQHPGTRLYQLIINLSPTGGTHD